ncbi:triacylglycerol lipase [Neofusicoccum parvum]|uniref:Triacylglycerol lipase n=1 Tax=Neofusicoccum parvum TaxID=310453 RepID=A0ACB5SCE2_9PEZI|nr:triacylglycerol lipase [Neofusicoccum parvum]
MADSAVQYDPARTQPPYPLHPAIAPRLDPVYRDFYNEHIADKQQVHLQPVAASRTSGVLLPGGGATPPVGSIRDCSVRRRETDGPEVRVRCFTPDGEAPAAGWPVAVWFHGGGWVLGNIDTENTVSANLCSRARWVVVSPDYRLGPEHPYPAAVHDSWETLLWLQAEGKELLNLDLAKQVVAGSSAGGNLAAIVAQKALARGGSPPLLAQFLCVPVTDNTADPTNNASWKELEFTPALPAAKMLWYRYHYLPNKEDWAHPESSPLLWEGDWSKLPPAIVTVGELDVLRDEGVQFAEKLRKAGVEAELHIMKGMPHPFLAMDGVLQQGRDTITFMVEGLKRLG